MANTFLIADMHLGHANMVNFCKSDGTKLRPFETMEEADEYMIKRWNETVSIQDKVYCLGDMVMTNRNLYKLGRLNGTKVLIKGNHDIFKPLDYLQYFKDIRAYHKLDKFWMTHVPIHPNCIPEWCSANVHGHLHSNVVTLGNRKVTSGTDIYNGQTDKRYRCVSVEHLCDYAPICFDEIRKEYA